MPLGKTNPRAFWWACVLAAPPLAWGVAAAGYGIAITSPWRDLGFIALTSAAEEIVFRGGLQQALLRSPRLAVRPHDLGVSWANLLTSLLFAAAHLWRHPPLAALGVLPVSLLLGAAFERRQRTLPAPITLHLYFNALLCAASLIL